MQTRSVGAPDLETRAAVSALQTAWTEFRSANDARLAEIEKRGSSDVIVTEKVDRINAAITDVRARIDELELRAKRSGAPADNDNDGTPEQRAYRADFQGFLKRGLETTALQTRAMSVSDNTDGGFLTAPEIDQNVARLQRDLNPIRQIVTVRSTTGTSYKRPISKSNNTSGWTGERTSRPQTNQSDLELIEIPTHEVYANVAATQAILDDGFINVEQWIAEETSAEFDRAEGDAFINGDGVAKPRGLVSLATTTETGSTRAAQGKLGVVKSGIQGKFGSSTEATPVYNDGDVFITLMGRMRVAYLANFRWLMNPRTEATVRKMKDANGQYIWQPGLQAGMPSAILGKPVTLADGVADVGNDTMPVMGGDFRAAYTIVDRMGIRVLRDPYTAKPYVLFYTTKRVGGGFVVTEAVKGILLSA
jgi:HK97 family phage major capsid protein